MTYAANKTKLLVNWRQSLQSKTLSPVKILLTITNYLKFSSRPILRWAPQHITTHHTLCSPKSAMHSTKHQHSPHSLHPPICDAQHNTSPLTTLSSRTSLRCAAQQITTHHTLFTPKSAIRTTTHHDSPHPLHPQSAMRTTRHHHSPHPLQAPVCDARHNTSPLTTPCLRPSLRCAPQHITTHHTLFTPQSAMRTTTHHHSSAQSSMRPAANHRRTRIERKKLPERETMSGKSSLFQTPAASVSGLDGSVDYQAACDD